MQAECSFGLYLVPDDPSVFAKAKSVSNGVDWGGIHMTIAGFSSSNDQKISLALERFKLLQHGRHRWHVNASDIENVTISGSQWNINSRTLQSLRDFLASCGVERLKTNFHLFFSEGWIDNEQENRAALKKQTWSLMKIKQVVKQDGREISWLNPRVEFFSETIYK
jgi:hypothetical protein